MFPFLKRAGSKVMLRKGSDLKKAAAFPTEHCHLASVLTHQVPSVTQARARHDSGCKGTATHPLALKSPSEKNGWTFLFLWPSSSCSSSNPFPRKAMQSHRNTDSSPLTKPPASTRKTSSARKQLCMTHS